MIVQPNSVSFTDLKILESKNFTSTVTKFFGSVFELTLKEKYGDIKTILNESIEAARYWNCFVQFKYNGCIFVINKNSKIDVVYETWNTRHASICPNYITDINLAIIDESQLRRVA